MDSVQSGEDLQISNPSGRFRGNSNRLFLAMVVFLVNEYYGIQPIEIRLIKIPSIKFTSGHDENCS